MYVVVYGTPNTKIFKTQKFYSRRKIYIQHLQNVFNFFKKHIEDIYLLFKIFKIHSRVTVLDMKKIVEYEKKILEYIYNNNSWICLNKIEYIL